MSFQISPKLSVASHLSQTYRQLFHRQCPATAKHLSPNLLWVCGNVSVLSVDKCRRRRPYSEMKWMSAVR